MSFREINDVDIVADSCAVVGFVVVSENGQMIKFPRCDLRDVWHEIVRDPFRIFADKPRFVRSYRVEIAQKHDIPRIRVVRFDVSGVEIDEDLFKHRLGLTVRIGAFAFRTLFGDGNERRIAVNGRRRRKNYVFAV